VLQIAFHQLPVKSHFEQVHRVSEFGGSNLVKTPFGTRWNCERRGRDGWGTMQLFRRVVQKQVLGRFVDVVLSLLWAAVWL
jgi:hypothetical protein